MMPFEGTERDWREHVSLGAESRLLLDPSSTSSELYVLKGTNSRPARKRISYLSEPQLLFSYYRYLAADLR